MNPEMILYGRSILCEMNLAGYLHTQIPKYLNKFLVLLSNPGSHWIMYLVRCYMSVNSNPCLSKFFQDFWTRDPCIASSRVPAIQPVHCSNAFDECIYVLVFLGFLQLKQQLIQNNTAFTESNQSKRCTIQ